MESKIVNINANSLLNIITDGKDYYQIVDFDEYMYEVENFVTGEQFTIQRNLINVIYKMVGTCTSGRKH